jgi:lantibiotic modifying enzyme
MKHGWRPLLDGDLGKQAIAAVHDIASALRKPQLTERIDGADASYRLGLASGLAGIALFYGYLAEAGLGADARDIAEDFLDQAAAGLAEHLMNPALFAGFTGIAWAHAHIRRRLFGERDRGSLTEIDDALVALLRRWRWPAKFDVLYGLAGIGVYALDRLPSRVGRFMVDLIVNRLDELAQRRGSQLAWFTPPEGIAHVPEGEFCLGMAHGTPGVMAFLARAGATVPTVRKKALSMLEAATAFLLEHRLSPQAGAGFPAWITRDGRNSGPARLAWCYGDPGVAAALLAAARATGRKEWEMQAVELALRAHSRSPQHNRVMDATLCHGAAGAGHIFNRLYQATGDARLAGVARHWFAHTLDEFRRAGQGIAGFLPFGLTHAEVGDTSTSRPEPGLLMGAAGIGLALLAAATQVEPGWDRAFMLDVGKTRGIASRRRSSMFATRRRPR